MPLLLEKKGERERICGVVFPLIASNDTLDPHHAADGRTDHSRWTAARLGIRCFLKQAHSYPHRNCSSFTEARNWASRQGHGHFFPRSFNLPSQRSVFRYDYECKAMPWRGHDVILTLVPGWYTDFIHIGDAMMTLIKIRTIGGSSATRQRPDVPPNDAKQANESTHSPSGACGLHYVHSGVSPWQMSAPGFLI